MGGHCKAAHPALPLRFAQRQGGEGTRDPSPACGRGCREAAGEGSSLPSDATTSDLIFGIVDDAGSASHPADATGNVVDAILSARMIREEARHRAVAALIHRQQLLEK